MATGCRSLVPCVYFVDGQLQLLPGTTVCDGTTGSGKFFIRLLYLIRMRLQWNRVKVNI